MKATPLYSGTLVVFEVQRTPDRAETCKKLVAQLNDNGYSTVLHCFPDGDLPETGDDVVNTSVLVANMVEGLPKLIENLKTHQVVVCDGYWLDIAAHYVYYHRQWDTSLNNHLEDLSHAPLPDVVVRVGEPLEIVAKHSDPCAHFPDKRSHMAKVFGEIMGSTDSRYGLRLDIKAVHETAKTAPWLFNCIRTLVDQRSKKLFVN